MNSVEIVKTTNLCKKYHNKVAVDQVNMSVHEGDIYGLVGKNGAGKTTLIRLLTGVISPTEGSYSLFGANNPHELILARKKIAAMIETPALFLNMTARENIKTRCILLGIDDENLITKRLEEVGLNEVAFSKKKAKDFSLGMRQRLGIAMSILGNPQLLILDEPTNGLDPKGIKEIRELLIKINKEMHITIIVSSHILSELSKFATTYGFMNDGKIIKEITADELFDSTRKSLILTVDQPEKCISFLRKEFPKFEIQYVGNIIRIFDIDDVSKVLEKLYVNSGVKIINLREEENSLEDYFLKLVGGAVNV